MCFSFDSLLHASNGFGKEGNLRSHGAKSKKATASRASRFWGLVRNVGSVFGSLQSSLSRGLLNWATSWGVARGKAGDDVTEQTQRRRVAKSLWSQYICARRDAILRFACNLATTMLSCYRSLKVVAAEQVLRAKTVVQGCRCLCNFARRLNVVNLDQTRSRDTTASPILTASTHPGPLRHMQASVESTAPCLSIRLS